MRDQTAFSVPRVRGDQLRDLAKHHRIPITELVGRWIDRELGEAGLSPDLPGVEITLDDKSIRALLGDLESGTDETGAVIDDGQGVGSTAVKIRVDDFALTFPGLQDALDAAEAIESVSERGGRMMLLPGTGALSVTRRGDGVVLETMASDGTISKKSFAPNVARALARQLRSKAH